MKWIFFLAHAFTFLCISSCERYEPHELYGSWKIDKLLEDGMDRTGWSLQQFPWGTGLEIMDDGTFRSNYAQVEEGKGRWKLSSDGERLYLDFPLAEPTSGFKITLTKEYLVLKSLRWHVFMSRTAELTLPAEKKVSMKKELVLGKWYFFKMRTQDSSMYYPRAKRRAHWVEINADGYYRSGEGLHESFYGRWALRADTLSFSEIGRVWKEQWKVRMEDDLLYFEPLTDDQAWYEVSLMHEADVID